MPWQVVECRTRDPEVLGSNPSVAKKKISYRKQYHHQSFCTRVKYMKLSEGLKLVACGRDFQDFQRPHWDSEPQCGQKENLSRSNQNNTNHQSLCTRVKYLKLSEVKIRSCRGMVQW